VLTFRRDFPPNLQPYLHKFIAIPTVCYCSYTCTCAYVIHVIFVSYNDNTIHTVHDVGMGAGTASLLHTVCVEQYG